MFKIIGGTDKGRMRASNQDTFAGRVLEENCAYGLVCDGLGGENGGETASQLACQEISRILEGGLRPDMSDRSVRGLMESALVTANAMVRRKAREDTTLMGMCTTAVAAVAQTGGQVTICHAGDSRAYRLRGEEVSAITTDHTLVQLLINEGKITEEQAADRPDRHHITRAVGAEDHLDVELSHCTLEEGDVLLLCSDGLYNMVDKGEYPALARQSLEAGNAGAFLDRANELGGADNITVLLLYV